MSDTEQYTPTTVTFYARGSGKTNAMIEELLARANKRGIRVEVVYPPHEHEATIRRDQIEKDAQIAANERLTDDTGMAEDIAYNIAVKHVTNALLAQIGDADETD